MLIAALPMPVPSRSLIPRVSVPFWLAPLRTFSTFASRAAILVFLALAVVSYFPRAQSASTGAAPAAAPAASPPFGPAGASAPQGSPGLSVSFTTTPVVTGDDRTAARPSATPSDAAKEAVGRQESASPSSNNVAANSAAADQATRTSYAAPEPAPFAILLSPWLWLVLALVFGVLSFVVGRRLRST
jgi:hypothetical protein